MIVQKNTKCPEYSLWIAVIDQALTDLKNQEEYAKYSAFNWFFKYSPDFEYVCSLVDLEPEFVRKIALKVQEEVNLRQRKKPKLPKEIHQLIETLEASDAPNAHALSKSIKKFALKMQKGKCNENK